MATRHELEEIESSPHVNNELKAGQVAKRLDDTIVLVVDDQGIAALAMFAVPELSFATAEFAGVGHLDDIAVRLEGLKECDSILGRLQGLGSGADEGNLLDFIQCPSLRISEGRADAVRADNGESALVLVNLDVPLASGLGRCEHATSTAHVSVSSLPFCKSRMPQRVIHATHLTRMVVSSTSDMGNTCNGEPLALSTTLMPKHRVASDSESTSETPGVSDDGVMARAKKTWWLRKRRQRKR